MLRKQLPISQLWIWFSIIGMGIPFVILDLIPNEIITHKLPFSITFGSLTVGYLQHIILKKCSPKARIWIVSSLVGWVLGVVVVFTVDYTNSLKNYIQPMILAFINLLLIFAGGIVLGVISGNSMKKILNDRHVQTP